MIGVITNPYARGVVADPLLPRRLEHIGGRHTRVVETRNLKELSEAVRGFAAAGVELVAVCGGDGTNLAVLTELMHLHGPELPRFAVLRGGTVNTVAANLGIKGSPEDILTRLVAWRSRGMTEPVVERQLLCVNGSCGFLFGAAMGARFFDAYYGGPFTGLPWASALAVRTTVSSLLGTAFARRLFEPVRARITVDGRQLPLDRWTLLVAATVENVGLQIRITYRALEREGHFHLVASGLPAFDLARQFHKTFLSRSLSGEPHFDLLGRETVIEFERPEPYIMDGDLFRASRLVLRQGPAVRLSVP
jgi:diacylglycerol kinase family enzyme